MTRDEIIARMPHGTNVTECDVGGVPAFKCERYGLGATISTDIAEPWASHAIEAIAEMLDRVVVGTRGTVEVSP